MTLSPWAPAGKLLSNHVGARSPCASAGQTSCGWGSDAPIGCMVSRACRCADYERPSGMWPLCKTIFFVQPTFARQDCTAFFLPRVVIFWLLDFLSYIHTCLYILHNLLIPTVKKRRERRFVPWCTPYGQAHSLLHGLLHGPVHSRQSSSLSSPPVSQYLSPSFTHARLVFFFWFFCNLRALFLQLIWQIHTLRPIGQWKQKLNSMLKMELQSWQIQSFNSIRRGKRVFTI